MPRFADALATPSLPVRIGPVEFGELGRMVAERWSSRQSCSAGGIWEPGSRRWLVDRRRVGPLIRTLEAATDPLFRRAGLVLEVTDARAPIRSPNEKGRL